MFYDVGRINHREMDISYYNHMPEAKNSYFQSILFRDNQRIYHARATYDILDLLGNLGGIVEIMSVIFGVFLMPISYHSYVVKAINRLFFVNSKEDYFVPSNDDDINPYDMKIHTMHKQII